MKLLDQPRDQRRVKHYSLRTEHTYTTWARRFILFHDKKHPLSLGASLEALAADYEYLLEGGVFTQDLIEVYYDYKKKNEVDPIALRPHPYEFNLYFDA